jgi:hypothetical protein
MFSEWFQPKLNIKVNFEIILRVLKDPDKYILINTLPSNEQGCLIKNTISYDSEEKTINDLLDNYGHKTKTFIIYGKNCSDDSVEKKRLQLLNLGITNVFVYCGGLFEWVLLQDIYGASEFPTSSKILDILKYK